MKKTSSLNRLFSLLLVFVMVFSLFSAEVFAEENENEVEVTWEQVENQWLTAALSDQSNEDNSDDAPEYKDSDVVRVSIVLEDDSTIAAGFSTKNIVENKKAMAYRSKLAKEQQRMESVISKQVFDGAELDVVWNLTLAANIISANVEYGKIAEIAALRGVKEVFIENRYEPVKDEDVVSPNMATSSDMTGATIAWAAGYTGAGSRVAIVDTGVDDDHQSFTAEGLKYAFAKNAEKQGLEYDEYVKSLNLLDAEEIASVWDKLNASGFTSITDPSKAYFSTKIAYAVNYIDRNLTINHDSDSQGEHGSHVTGIALANRFIPDGEGGFTNAIESVKTQGNACDAQILTMKVFGRGGGAYDADYMSAIEDAIILKADAVNLSLGSSNAGASYSSAAYEAIMDAITESGTTVCISSGNNSYWAENSYFGYLYPTGVNYHTNGSPGSFTNSFTVASVDNDGFTGNYFKCDGADTIYTYTETTGYRNQPFTSIAGEYDYVMLPRETAGQEETAFAAIKDAVAGKVAFAWRGSTSFYQKAEAAVNNGAIATVICNNQPGTISMDLSSYTKTPPCVSITENDAYLIMANATPVKDENDNVLYYTGKFVIEDKIGMVVYNSDYYTMSDFSSWGMPGNMELTPEITAPGGAIYSVNGAVAGGKSYETMSGTSMASPQVAGLVGVLAQYIRENDVLAKTGLTERQLAQSLLMSTSEPLVCGDSKSYYAVFQQGSGLARIDRAVSAHSFILMDENATESYFDGKVKAELGDDPDRTGEYSFSFSINNFTKEARTYELSADFFTQDIFEDDELGLVLDTWTTPLYADVTWTVDGNEVDPSAAEALWNADFDGDGDIDLDDGQALLDWLVGNREEIFNMEYADFDEDSDIDTYDAYLFYLLFSTGAVVIPGNSSVNVTVSAKMLNIDDYDFNGAYVEGYVYAKEMSSDEGVEGDVHSIPVLAYYGNWTDPSMFDNGTYWEHQYGLTEEYPYLYNNNKYNVNYFQITYAATNKAVNFGGNPVVKDATYMPERTAFNNKSGDRFTQVRYSLIRNAQTGCYTVTGEDGTVYSRATMNGGSAAYWNESNQAWSGTSGSATPNFDFSKASEGEKVEIAFTMLPEYYVNADGSVRWDEAGEGASLKHTVVIDNTAPSVSNIKYIEEKQVSADPSVDDVIKKTLTFTVSDNQYVAGIGIYDSNNRQIKLVGSDPDAEAGATSDYEVDLGNTTATKFLVEVYDYAYNATSYKVNLNKEEALGEITISVSPATLRLTIGTTGTVTASVGPWGTPNETVTWSSSDETVATVDQFGKVTATGAGSCSIIATSNADSTKTASCTVSVDTLKYVLYGELTDKDGKSQTFYWNLAAGNKTWTKVADFNDSIMSGTVSRTADHYINMNAAGTMIQKVNFNTGEIVASHTSDAPCADMMVFDTGSDDKIIGVYDAYLFDIFTMETGNTGMAYDLSQYLADDGASKFLAICSNAYSSGWGGTTQTMYTLDDAGYIYNWTWNIASAGLSNVAGPYKTDLAGKNFPGNGNGATCVSMVRSSNSANTLFVAAYDGSVSRVYMLTRTGSSRTGYTYTAVEVARFEDGIQPVVLTKAVSNNTGILAVEDEVEEVARPVEVKPAMIDLSAEADGTLNSVEEPVIEIPNPFHSEEDETVASSVEISEDETTVTVTLVAHDSEGKNLDTTNGLATVEYDAELLELVSVEMKTQYSSVNDSEDGKVVLDYVDVAGLKAGETVAILTFKVKDTDDTEIKVTWDDMNEEDLEIIETEDPENPDEPIVETEGEPFDEDLDVIYDHDYDDDGRCIHCGKERPRTGDEQKLSVWTLVFLFSAAGLVLLKKRYVED